MTTITGDTTGMQSLSRTWGGAASSAGTQAANFSGAYGALPPSSFSGGAADRMRSFATEMRAGAAALARAYDRVASVLPRVARAIDEAKLAALALEQAQKALKSAEERLAAAERAVSAATTAVTSPTSPLSAASPLAGAPGCAPTGPSPAQLAALQQALLDQRQAGHDVQRAAHEFQVADTRFQEANRNRMSVLRSFTALCQTESAIAMRALPEAPNPPTGFPGLMGLTLPVPPLATMLLTPEARALADVPVLAWMGFMTITVPQLTSALRHQQWQQIEGALPTFSPPVATPQKKSGGGGLLGTLSDVGGFFERMGKGVVDGVAGGAVGLYHLGKLAVDAAPLLVGSNDAHALRAGGELLGMAEAPFVHPVRFFSQVVDLPDLEKDPAHWLGGMMFTGAFTFATDGVGAEAKVAEASAKAAKAESAGRRAVTPIAHAVDPSYGAIARTNADHFEQLGTQLEATNKRLETVHKGLDSYDKVSSRVGWDEAKLGASQPEECHAGAGGIGRDSLTGKLVEHLDRGVLPR